MDDKIFRQTLVRHMCDDLPTLDDITKAERKDREHILNCVSVSKGYTDWIDAYHRFDTDANLAADLRSANREDM